MLRGLQGTTSSEAQCNFSLGVRDSPGSVKVGCRNMRTDLFCNFMQEYREKIDIVLVWWQVQYFCKDSELERMTIMLSAHSLSDFVLDLRFSRSLVPQVPPVVLWQRAPCFGIDSGFKSPLFPIPRVSYQICTPTRSTHILRLSYEAKIMSLFVHKHHHRIIVLTDSCGCLRITIEAIRDKRAASQSPTFSKYAENDPLHQRLKLQASTVVFRVDSCLASLRNTAWGQIRHDGVFGFTRPHVYSTL